MITLVRVCADSARRRARRWRGGWCRARWACASARRGRSAPRSAASSRWPEVPHRTALYCTAHLLLYCGSERFSTSCTGLLCYLLLEVPTYCCTVAVSSTVIQYKCSIVLCYLLLYCRRGDLLIARVYKCQCIYSKSPLLQ